MTDIRMSGNRASWIQSISGTIMDGGAKPPSVSSLVARIPDLVPTAQNDGHTTAAKAGLDRKDFKAGWKLIVEEVVETLAAAGMVEEREGVLRWTGPTEGTFPVQWGTQTFTLYSPRARTEARDQMHVRAVLQGSSDRKVSVIGPRGGVTERTLSVHPFAEAIPMMSEEDWSVFRADVERSKKIHEPLKLFQDKVLDGRHRLYLANDLCLPVRVTEFEGTEEEARAYVFSAGIARRHLNKAQIAEIAERLLLPEARKEAEAAKRASDREPKRNRQAVDICPSPSEARKARDIAAAKTGNAVSGKAVERMGKALAGAPKTRERVQRGEIKTVSEATKAGAEERGETVTPQAARLHPTSVFAELGRMISAGNRVLNELDLPAGATEGEIDRRLDDINKVVADVRKALRARGKI